ncbi:MAG TPA: BTAD domain-containing putative transcriptional regulator, partial [Anaerolineae bacterium]
MPSPHLYLLGAPKFELNRKPVQVGSAKAVALLGYLAATGEPQSRERILGLLWSESAEDAARKNLRNTLWSIRKALGDGVLMSGDDHLSIDKSVWIDVREFEKLVTPSAISDPEPAIRLFRGDLLEGIDIADAPEFEVWLTGARERLAQLYSRALSTEVESLRDRSDWHGVIDMARRALAHDNLQEPMYRALMQAHGRLGERAEALRQYDTLHSTLERELGVEPLPETQSLRAAILNGSILPDDGSGAVA